MTPHEIKAAVDAGARFVFFQFCISALVITFKRPSPIYFLQPGEGTFVRQLPFTLISLVGGWWGIPWGPIWTISTTITNLSGGKDVTHEILARIGAPTTTTMGGPPGLAVSGLRKPGLSTAHKVLIGAAVTIALLAIIGMASLLINHADRLPRTPGEIEVRAAADLLGSGKAAGSGNSAEARKLANDMSETMTKIREAFFEKANRASLLDSHDVFRTYCDLRENQCVFLVHVPELRRFSSDAKESLGKSAWTIANEILKSTGHGKEGMRLAVGLRGIVAFDHVLIGRFEAEYKPDAMSIRTVRGGFGSERELYSWFAPTNAISTVEQP